MSAKRKAESEPESNRPVADIDGRDASPVVKSHDEMMAACEAGNLDAVRALLRDASRSRHDDGDDAPGAAAAAASSAESELDPSHLLAAQQSPATGLSPLMMASKGGHVEVCRALLDAGAPWNAVDRTGKCAGNYATDGGHWDVVNLLVEEGTKAELILGASIRLARQIGGSNKASGSNGHADSNATNTDEVSKEKGKQQSAAGIPVSHQPCTKPDYLQANVRYNAANTLLLDNDDDAVMMEWERPLMKAHASILTQNGAKGKRVLNVGFGLGIIDTALQLHAPSLHVIIEAHPTVYEKMVKDGWDKRDNVRVCFGRWQDELPKLIEEGVEFDGVFYDTYGEHFTDLEDFHELMTKVLHKPDGIYSFFNGLAPDNLFFHGVACQCVNVQLSHLGMDTEFAQCEIQVKDSEWEGVRRRYWHGRDTYYLPIATWKKDR